MYVNPVTYVGGLDDVKSAQRSTRPLLVESPRGRRQCPRSRPALRMANLLRTWDQRMENNERIRFEVRREKGPSTRTKEPHMHRGVANVQSYCIAQPQASQIPGINWRKQPQPNAIKKIHAESHPSGEQASRIGMSRQGIQIAAEVAVCVGVVVPRSSRPPVQVPETQRKCQLGGAKKTVSSSYSQVYAKDRVNHCFCPFLGSVSVSNFSMAPHLCASCHAMPMCVVLRGCPSFKVRTSKLYGQILLITRRKLAAQGRHKTGNTFPRQPSNDEKIPLPYGSLAL